MRFLLVVNIILFSCYGYSQENTLQNSIELGEKIYARKCSYFHSKDGAGRGNRFPPLASSDYLANNKEASISAIIYGLSEEITVNGVVYNRKMKAVKLTDKEVADVMNYIQNSWGNKNDQIVTENEVNEIRLKFSD